MKTSLDHADEACRRVGPDAPRRDVADMAARLAAREALEEVRARLLELPVESAPLNWPNPIAEEVCRINAELRNIGRP